MPTTAVFRVQASDNDGFLRAGGSITRAETTLFIGDLDSVNFDYQAYARLTYSSGTAPGQGQVIQSARLFVTQKAARSTSYAIKYHLEASDNPAIPSAADMHPSTGRPQVGSVTHNTNAAWVVDQVYSVDVTALVQAVLNRSGYVAGNPFQFRLDPNEFGGYGGTNTLHQLHSYDNDPAKAMRLEITYEPPAYNATGTAAAPGQTTSGTGSSSNPATTGTGTASAPAQTASGTGSSSNPATTATGSAAAPTETTSGTGDTSSKVWPGPYLLESITNGLAALYPYSERADNPRVGSKFRYEDAAGLALERLLNPAAGQGVQLALQGAGENLLRWSEDFSGASWALLSGATRAGNLVSDESTTATSLIQQSAAISPSAAYIHIRLAFAKKPDATASLRVEPTVTGGTSTLFPAFWIRPDTGAVVAKATIVENLAVADLGDAWEVTCRVANNGGTSCMMRMWPTFSSLISTAADATLTGSLELRYAQLSYQDVPYTPTTDTPIPHASGFVEWHTAYAGTEIRLRYRERDASNYWSARLTATGTLELREALNGTVTTRASKASAVVSGNSYRVVVKVIGARHEVYLDDVLTLTYTDPNAYHAAERRVTATDGGTLLASYDSFIALYEAVGTAQSPEASATGEGSTDNPSFTGEGIVAAPEPTASGAGRILSLPPPPEGPLQMSPQSELADAVARHMLGLLPPGRRPKEGGYAFFTVLALSALLAEDADAVIQMIFDWSPSRTRREDLLALIGQARGIKRGKGEPFEAYRARVVGAEAFWRLGGTVPGVKKALETAGYGVKVIEHFHKDKVRWAEFSIELYPDRAEFTSDLWDDPEGYWDDGTPWDWGISTVERERIRDIIHEMKAGHSRVRNVFYLHGGPLDYWNDDNGTWDDESRWHGFDPIQVI